MILFLVSLVAGVLTVLAPCILPLLPVVVGSSLVDGKRNMRRAFVIVGSLGASVVLFTLLLKASTLFISIPQSVWTYFSGGIVLVFGLTLVFPSLWERLPFLSRISANANRVLGTGHQKKNTWGDIIIGAALGPVFSTCSPTYFIVLATVLPERPLVGMIYLLAYVFGLSVALLSIALVGQRLADKLNVAADSRGSFKRTLGILFIIVGIVIATGYDKKIQIQLLDWGLYDITKVEQFLLQMSDKKNVEPTEAQSSVLLDAPMRKAKKEQLYSRAVELVRPHGYINTEPITIDEFRGKNVVLLDIWTYSCINCQRTIPHLTAWDEKYRAQGLTIIGLHTPEFSFEKVKANVERAVKEFGIEYPVVLDNDYETWRAYENNYWPRKYLIDIDGYIVYDHIGEGAYEETEKAIQRALAERAEVLGQKSALDGVVSLGILAPTTDPNRTPEIYFGAQRNLRLGNGRSGEVGVQAFTLPKNISRDRVYLEGEFMISKEYTRSDGKTKIVMPYHGNEVYFVARADSPVSVRVLHDGKPVEKEAGADITNGSRVIIQEERLYKLIKNPSPGPHTLELEIEGAGLEAYTFTFG